MLPRQFIASCRDRLARSRFFTLSLTLHLILIALFGGAVIIDVKRQKETSGEITACPGGLVQELPKVVLRPPPTGPTLPPKDMLTLKDVAPVLPPVDHLPTPIITDGPSRYVLPPTGPQVVREVGPSPVTPQPSTGISREDANRIKDFADWRPEKGGKDRFAFTAYIGRYQGGNWNSTVRMTNNEITGGSLPNLLYAMSEWSNHKIETNERKVKALALDSDELLATRPPFIFLTGTRDFKLTDKEIENLRRYIRSGGAVWGDSSVPGERSAFDIAFRREMQRVLPDSGQKFEDLPASHAVFTAGYFPRVKNLPSGVNHYREPVSVLRWNGEIAVIQTRNDYGDMWQVGLGKDGKIDLSRNARGEYVAMDSTLWNQRGIYVRNIEQPAVEEAYKFGINMVMHLLTRWDKVTQNGASL